MEPRWELWRLDDNGNRVMIGAFGEQAAAEAELARFEALHHKQTYWVERRPPGGEPPARGGGAG